MRQMFGISGIFCIFYFVLMWTLSFLFFDADVHGYARFLSFINHMLILMLRLYTIEAVFRPVQHKD